MGLCVCCLSTAGQLDVSWALGNALVSAVVHAPFLGMTAGDAIAAVLTGAANPSGRLTATWYTQGGGCRARACLWCWRCLFHVAARLTFVLSLCVAGLSLPQMGWPLLVVSMVREPNNK